MMSLDRGLVTLEKRTGLLRIILLAYAAISSLMILIAIGEANGIVDLEQPDLNAISTVAAVVAVMNLVMLLVSIVVTGMWIYRAHANLQVAEIDGLEFTPGWAVGWFFVPFANLIQPFKAMRSLWNESHRQYDSFGGQSDSRLTLWWGCWIVGNVISNVGNRGAWRGPDGNTVGLFLDGLAAITLAAAAWFLFQIITEINRAQQSMMGIAATFE